MSAWQPIETAPKDGTEMILLRYDDATNHLAIGHYMTDTAWMGHSIPARFFPLQDATHWMPLPAPPVQS